MSIIDAREPLRFSPEHFQKVGIYYIPQTLGEGYIKLHESDFIVEEISTQGTLQSINSPLQERQKLSGLVSGTLIKKGCSTFAALHELSQNYDLSSKSILYAGLKDDRAITSQEITLKLSREVSFPFINEKVILTNVHSTHYPLRIGQLWGNRFTILVRSNNFNNGVLPEKIDSLKTKGFPNFFSLQRFGIRQNNHTIGRAILQGNYEEALRLLLVDSSPYESKSIEKIRLHAVEVFGNWEEMMRIFQPHKHMIFDAIKILSHLCAEPKNYAAALDAVPETIRLCVSAYVSYCFNKLLSLYLQSGQIPEKIPLLHPHPTLTDYYNQLLPEENVDRLQWNPKDIKNIATPNINYLPSIVVPSIYGYQIQEGSELYHFDLPKGSYATGFLSEIYTLYQDFPLPEWVNQHKKETREQFGYTSVSDVISRFRFE